MITIYYEKDYPGGWKKSRENLKEFLMIYAAEKGLTKRMLPNEKIQVDINGKPFLQSGGAQFSVSHTGNLWACAFAHEPIGFDIQEIRNVDHNKLAERFFTTEEADYVKEHGREGFFDIWVRKEAYVKYTGKGIVAEGFKKFNTVNSYGDLLDSIDGKDKVYILIPDEEAMAEVGENYRMAVCCEHDDFIEIEEEYYD